MRKTGDDPTTSGPKSSDPKSKAARPEARDRLLDAAERLMSERGYAGTPVSAVCAEAGVAATSLYWHFGSKEGLLATVMERGAQRWFAALPAWDERGLESVVRDGADAVAANPLFLRLTYLLALEGGSDEVAAELVRRVRRHAMEYFRAGVRVLLGADHGGTSHHEAAVDELARFAVAYSDGCFFAGQLEPDRADLRRMYGDLVVALRALAPAVLARASATQQATDETAHETTDETAYETTDGERP